MTSPDSRSPAPSSVQDAYGAWSVQYADLFGSADNASAEDRAVITRWAETVIGPVLDAGCGPGQWSAFLHSLGLQVEGVDATAAFVQHATRSYPQITFRLGDLRALELPPKSLGGVLVWFSLIHLDPSEVPDVIARLVAALRPTGTLLIGYFSGPELKPFDHAVVTAWAWPPLRMKQLLECAGLDVLTQAEHPQSTGRVFAELTARRPLQPRRSAACLASCSRSGIPATTDQESTEPAAVPSASRRVSAVACLKILPVKQASWC